MGDSIAQRIAEGFQKIEERRIMVKYVIIHPQDAEKRHYTSRGGNTQGHDRAVGGVGSRTVGATRSRNQPPAINTGGFILFI